MWSARGRYVQRDAVASPDCPVDRNCKTRGFLKMTLLASLPLGLHVSLLIPIVVATVEEKDPELTDEMEKMIFVNVIGNLLLGSPLLFPKKHRHVYDEHLYNMIKFIVLGGAIVFHIASAYLFNGFVKMANVKLVVSVVIHFFALIAEAFNMIAVYFMLLFTWNAVKDNDINNANSIPLVPV